MSRPEPEIDKVCLVCGKPLRHDSDAIARLQVAGHMVALCCPLCFQAYHNNPARFSARVQLLLLGGLSCLTPDFDETSDRP